MKKLLVWAVYSVVILAGCATARPMVTHKEAIKTAENETSALVEKFCVLKDVTGAEQKLGSIQSGIEWAIECEKKINSATEEEKQRLLLFKKTTEDWMKEIKAGDKDRLIRWTADNIPPILGGGKKSDKQ